MELIADGIIFDLDGTLIDSAPDICSAVNTLLIEESYTPLKLDAIREMLGLGATYLIKRVLSTVNGDLADFEIQSFVNRYINNYYIAPCENTVIYPGVQSTLEELTKIGIPLGICTNKPYKLADLILENIGIKEYFKIIIGGDSVPHPKPDPRHLLYTKQCMGINSERVAYVGDSSKDVTASISAKIPIIAVSYGYCRNPESLLEANKIIDNFEDLIPALKDVLN